MKDLLVVGNGFDLYHGLPTRYIDFLSFIGNWNIFWENYKNIESGEEELQFSVRLSEYNELIPETMMDFAVHSGHYKYENLEFINAHIDNSWIQYFLKRQLGGTNWIDFESEIYNVLRLVEKYYSEFIPEMRKRKDIPIKYIPRDMSFVISIFENKCPDGYEDLTRRTLDEHSLTAEEIKKNKRLLLETMKSELDNLIRCLRYYLFEFVTSIKIEKYSEQIKELSIVNLLNFNYTYTFATVYGKTKLNQHHRIHGDCLEENMVLGIPDEAFSDTLDYIYFQKYFQRIQKRTGNVYKTWISAPDLRVRTLDDVPINVYIMGHSLADSDQGILKDIFLNDFVQKITIYYHSQWAYEQQVINLIAMFGKNYVIEQTGKERIVFEKLKEPVNGMIR